MTRPHRIILTGASAGIGRALALEYARRGAQLVLVARREELLRQLAGEVGSAGGEAAVLAVDITGPGASERIVALAHEKFGGIDLVVMNAGMGAPTWVHDFDAAQTEHVMEVNYFSVVRMIEAVLPGMLAAGRGHIAAVSSLAAYRGMPGSAAYNASKAAVTILMESLRTELRPTGVKVTTIAPGFVRTAMTGQNEFTMPFLMEPEEAARRIAGALDAARSEYRFPLMTSLAVRFLQILPNSLYDRLMLWGRNVGKE
jgi:short-subunit dehydrogenase